MNALDVVALIVFLVCVYGGYKKGLIVSMLGFFSVILALILSVQIYPIFSKFILEKTSASERLTKSIVKVINLEENVKKTDTLKQKTELIEALPLPEFVTKNLIKNNNPEIYKLLKVSTIENYIAKYIAFLCINIISMIIVFIASLIVIKILTKSLDIVAKLPVINIFNKAGGAAIGCLQGFVAVFVLQAFLLVLSSSQQFSDVGKMLDKSAVSSLLFELNVLFKFIS